MPWLTSDKKQKEKEKKKKSKSSDDLKERAENETDCGPGHGEAKEEVLLQIHGAIAHLIDTEQSAHLASGLFSLILLTTHHGSNPTDTIFVTIGEHLSFPLSRCSISTKLDTAHYFFTLRIPPEIEEDSANSSEEEDPMHDSFLLHYGVTFTNREEFPMLALLDKYLEEYSIFSQPRIVVTSEEAKKKNLKGQECALSRDEDITATAIAIATSCPKEREPFVSTACPEEHHFAAISRPKSDGTEHLVATSCPKDKGKKPSGDPSSRPEEEDHDFVGTPCPKGEGEKHLMATSWPKEEEKLVEEKSSVYWTTLAPDVEDYSSFIAKGIAIQTGYVIKGIFWCSDSTIEQLERLGDYAKSRMKTNDKPSQISPRTLRNLRRVKKVSKMTERFAKGVLAGVITMTSFMSVSAIKSKAGKKLFKMLPGEVALVSLDAFGKMFDAVELAGKNVLNSTRVVTSDVVEHKYGEQAGEVTDEGLKTAGHMIGTAWTVLKIRKAFDPKKDSDKVSKKGKDKGVP